MIELCDCRIPDIEVNILQDGYMTSHVLCGFEYPLIGEDINKMNAAEIDH